MTTHFFTDSYAELQIQINIKTHHNAMTSEKILWIPTETKVFFAYDYLDENSSHTFSPFS